MKQWKNSKKFPKHKVMHAWRRSRQAVQSTRRRQTKAGQLDEEEKEKEETEVKLRVKGVQYWWLGRMMMMITLQLYLP